MQEEKGWLRAHWRTGLILVLIFGVALFVRVYFVYGLAFTTAPTTCDANFVVKYSGGSDSYYWDRALCYSFQTGKDLGTDGMLNYPVSFPNPRPPLFPWFSLLAGRALAPLFGNAWSAVYFVFLLSSGLFGALIVFPTYALGKEAFGRKAGLIGALLLAISVGNLQRSNATDADHDAFTLFFVVSTFYFFLRALKTMKGRRWVEGWFTRAAIVSGLRSFFRENRPSVLYALLAGLCVTVIALAWQGWAYVSVILLVWFAAELFIDRFRNEDTMGVWILFTIALATPIVLAFQWYYVRNNIRVWFDVPAYLFLASIVVGLAFTVTRDYPWTLVIPSTVIAGGVGLAVGIVVNPTLASAFVTGAGYFIQSKVVTTIAEDQAPGMSQLILSFGWFTFYISLGAVAFMLWQIPRRREPAFRIAVIWAFVAIFMAITAARFIFNASPAFAITAGYAIDQVLIRADFAGMRRTYRSLSSGNWRNAVRKSVKARHVITALLIVFLVLLPNVWFGLDAAMPFEVKSKYDRQVASLLPTFLRAPGYNPSGNQPFYFGAFGYTLPAATDYYPAAWSWFRTQDPNEPPELRPAYLSWWDYGFEAVDRGAHPTVADNFQNGYALAGQFLTAQNETQATALLAVRLIEGDFRAHSLTLGPEVRDIMAAYGLPATTFARVLARPTDYVALVLSDPTTYGVWDSNMHALNAQYILLTHELTERFGEEKMTDLYHALRDATGRDIGYFAVDSRLFPISATNTGIFYAPVKLSDHRVIQLPSGLVLPFEFFQVFANTSRATNVPIQQVRPGDQIQSQRIAYQAPFYDSMFYRAYIGYSPADLGSPNNPAIPGFDPSLQQYPPVPAWNLTHWRVVYRTSYYNPYPDVANHTDAWQAMNYDAAQQKQTDITAGKIKGLVDLSTLSTVANGVVFLRYYDGAWVNGTVSSNGIPLSGVNITVVDELNTPHYVTQTDAQGHYSALVPFGNITITASVGTKSRTGLIGPIVLATATFPVTMDQAMRVPADSNGDGIPDWLMTRDLSVPAHTLSGTLFFDLDRSGAYAAGDAIVPGAPITLTNKNFPFARTTTTAQDGGFSIDSLPQGSYGVTTQLGGRTIHAADTGVGTADATRNQAVPYATVHGVATASGGGPVGGAVVETVDATNGTTFQFTAADDGSYALRPLLAGNYTITATSGNLASNPARLSAAASDLWVNLTLQPSGAVSGFTTIFGTDQPFATLAFQSATSPPLVRTVTSDASAQYSITLPAGQWFVNGRSYNGAALYATLGTVTVTTGQVTAFDAMFVQGVRVSGNVFDATGSSQSPQASVVFANDLGQLGLTTSPTGGYLAFLPASTYNVEAFNAAGASYGSAALGTSRVLDIHLMATSETVTWSVYRDLNGNGAVDPGEAIPGASVALTDDLGAHIALTTSGAGTFTIPLFANRTYAGSVTAAGFDSRAIPTSTPADLRALQPIALTATPVQVQGSVLLNGAPLLNRPITVRAVAIGDGAVGQTTLTDSNGGYSLPLVPGTYNLVVDENVSTTQSSRYQNRGTDAIAVSVAATSVAYDIGIVVRNLVLGNVTLSGTARAASLSFDGPEHRTAEASPSGFQVYLIPGTYSVFGTRQIVPDQYAFIATATVPSATNFSFALVKATSVLGHALFNGAAVVGPMPVSFVRAEGGFVNVTTDSFGAYAASVIPGNYTVTLTGTSNATGGGVSRFYRYAFSGTLTVAPGVSSIAFDLVLDRTLDNTTVMGTVSVGGLGVDATVSFFDRGGGAITATASSGSNGAYSVGLAPGTYDAYASRSVGSSAFLARITIPHAASFARDIPLSNGFQISGVTTDPQGARTSASIAIQSTAELDLTSDASGAFAAILPAGTFTITATKPGTENGISVTYRATTTVVLQTDSVVNLALAKVIERSVVLSWDASQKRQIAAGDSVTYTIVVRNTGNVADTWSLSGRPTDWQFSFAPPSLNLGFGNAGSSAVALVTVTSPSNALVNHGTITLTATSTTDDTTQGSVDIQIDTARTRGLAISLDATSGVFDGRFLNYTLTITNSGNAPETVNIQITNPDDLAASGWIARLGTSTGPASDVLLSGVTVAANSTTKVRLQAQSSGGASGATVVIQVAASDAMTVSATGIFTLQLPQLESGGTSVSGPEIVHEAPLNLQLLAIVTGALAAIGIGLFLTRRRR
ncbi:MAG TPA: SdrD B-like domain-containing protein [Thermoplasmata archaeon]|nr:SdrD B-like domain-containing protein [Thermoplasmata archaeon]